MTERTADSMNKDHDSMNEGLSSLNKGLSSMNKMQPGQNRVNILYVSISSVVDDIKYIQKANCLWETW
jgi:hypothetical protein